MRFRQILIAALGLAAGCSSATQTDTTPASGPPFARPAVEVRQRGPIFFGSGTSAPVTLDVQITNRDTKPMTLRRVRIESPGMSQYTLRSVTWQFNETIASGETRTVPIYATAVTNRTRLSVTEPLTIRALLHFEVDGKQRLEVFSGYVQE